jgi:hypothetical protein
MNHLMNCLKNELSVRATLKLSLWKDPLGALKSFLPLQGQEQWLILDWY